MGAIIDILIAAIIILTLFFAVKNGFSKTAIGALGFFIAAAVALIFCGRLGSFVAESGVGDRIESAVDAAVDSIVNEENYVGIFEAGDENGESALSLAFTVFGAEDVYKSISEGYHAHVSEGLASARAYIKGGLAEHAIPFCCKVLAFLALFLCARLILKIVEIVISKVTELPVLKQADKVLGALAGVLLAVLRVYVFCMALKILLPAAGALGFEKAAGINLGDSYLFSLFERYNILSKLI